MSEISAGNPGVREPADTTASKPGEMTQLFAAIMGPPGETADAASSRGTSSPRASLPMQAAAIDPAMATTAGVVVVSASPASEAETQTLRMPGSQDTEATTQKMMAGGLADPVFLSVTEPESALPSILKRQGSIAKMFVISDSEPREWEWHEAMEAVSPGEGEAVNVSDSDLIVSQAALTHSRKGDGMTELLHTLDGSAKFLEAPKLDARADATAEFRPMVRASQPGEDGLRGAPQGAAAVVAESQPAATPSVSRARFLPMLLLAIAVLLVANLVAMLMRH